MYKVVWRCAKTRYGVPCVMKSGAVLMDELYANNLDILEQVFQQLKSARIKIVMNCIVMLFRGNFNQLSHIW